MPSIAAHMIVAKEVGNRLNLFNPNFIRGNLLPDIIDLDNSHYKIQKEMYLVPDINACLKNVDLSNSLYMGYLVHLLLDKHYLEDYLEVLYPDINVFSNKDIYKDYDYLNDDLVHRFQLDVDYLLPIFKQYDYKIKEESLELNIKCLKQKTIGVTKYLDFNNFSNFLLFISEQITKELVYYANKCS